ncbi:hypothetical protein LWI28_013671 [Acer negundo]|uniref:Uncharacterized protein n=1 Tax=Acer negundo TaxID=4023 RepID=A0AAD5J9Z7_ACENE|nr:hypothetical protein LWI28_013671 [Acer negundo]
MFQRQRNSPDRVGGSRPNYESKTFGNCHLRDTKRLGMVDKKSTDCGRLVVDMEGPNGQTDGPPKANDHTITGMNPAMDRPTSNSCDLDVYKASGRSLKNPDWAKVGINNDTEKMGTWKQVTCNERMEEDISFRVLELGKRTSSDIEDLRQVEMKKVRSSSFQTKGNVEVGYLGIKVDDNASRNSSRAHVMGWWQARILWLCPMW